MSSVVAVGFGIPLMTLIALISALVEAQSGTRGIAQSFAALSQTVVPTLAASFFAFGLSIGVVRFAFLMSAGLMLAIIPLMINLGKCKKTQAF
jgi:uncharacterized PurR-regulated membrane protein YhhQ (DUF165 family)